MQYSLVHHGLLQYILVQLEDTARYAGLLIAPSEGFSLQPRLFCPSGKKKGAYYSVLAHFWQLCPVATIVTFSSLLSNFEGIPHTPPPKKK